MPLAESQPRRGSERVIPFPEKQHIHNSLKASDSHPSKGLYNADSPVHVYPYGVSCHLLEEVIGELNLPVVVVRDIDDAEAILVLRSHARRHANFQRMVADYPFPFYSIKANASANIIHALYQALGMESPDTTDAGVDQLANSQHSEIDTLEEARLAVEQIVIPKGQPVELLPRSAKVRSMQHELVERYRLLSHSFGEEPFRRFRIYPNE